MVPEAPRRETGLAVAHASAVLTPHAQNLNPIVDDFSGSEGAAAGSGFAKMEVFYPEVIKHLFV